MRFKKLIIFVCLSFLLVASTALAYSSPGKAAGFVNDYAGILTAEQKNALETKLSQFASESSNEIVIVTIKSLGGDTIENYAVKLFAEWGIGKAKQDNGLLFLVALDDRQMRLEVGYGLEGALPDATAYQITSKILQPAFAKGDYYGGLNQATEVAISATRGEYQGVAATASSPIPNVFKKIGGDFFLFLIFIAFSLLSGLYRFLAKSKSWWQGGVLGLIVGLIIAVIFFRAVIALLIGLPIVLIVFGLLFDYLASCVLPQPKPGKRGGGFWIFPGGGGGGGGGFGGFGGGGSGGGGSSGGW